MNAARLISTGPLVLVNRDHPLPAQPDARELVMTDPRRPDILLHSRAAAILRKLISDLGCNRDIVPVSGYRGREEQERIFADSLREHGRAFTETYVARPGCSEHETGLAIDLGENVPDLDFIRPSFPDSGACRAFRLRAADYGFILRYPAGKERITGIGHEPWHFRYVGWPHARLMAERDMVLEEYIDWLSGFGEDGAHLGYAAAGRAVELFTVPQHALDGLPERLPAALPWQWSGNNSGGAVVTLWTRAG